MEICKNKVSGKYFIYIENTGNDKALFVTPLGHIKPLELRLFDQVEETDEDHLLSCGLITKLQTNRYHEFMEKEPVEAVKRAMEIEKEPLKAMQRAEESMTRRQWKHYVDKLVRMENA